MGAPMKFTILAILVIILVLSFVVPFLYKELKNLASFFVNWIFGNTLSGSDAKPGTLAPAAQTGIQGIPTSTATSKTKNRVPENFRGPTGEPHIIGPSGPPPNY